MKKITILVLICSFFQSALADSNDGIKRLVDASCDLNIPLIQSILSEGVNPNDFYKSDFPLQCAAAGVHSGAAIQAIKILINAGANPNLQNVYGRTALMSAVEHYHFWRPDIAQELLNSGANIDLQDRDGETVLMHVGWRPAAVEFLIKAGANVDIQNKLGDTALMRFIQSISKSDPTYMDSIDFILKAKPNLEIERQGQPYYSDRAVRTALDWAVYYSHTDVVRSLLKAGAKVDSIGRSALNVAANSSSVSIEVASILLEAGAQINFRDEEGSTPLINSIKGLDKHIVMSKFLIASGADLNLKDNQGNTALILTANRFYRIETLLALLEAGANPNIQNKDGVTAIMGILNQVDIFQKFVDSGANLDLQDLNGMTVLMKNIDYLESVDFFIKAGAHLNLRNSEGKTALGLASYTPVRNALIGAGGIE